MTNPYNTDDRAEDLVIKAKAGDARAFEELVELYKHYIYRVASSLNIKERESLYQEGVIGLWRAVKGYNGKSAVSPFLKMCIKRQMLTQLRSRYRIKNQIIEDGIKNGECLNYLKSPSTEKIMIERETIKVILGNMRKILSELEYRVIVMNLNGYNYREISQKLGLAEKKVDNALTRAKNKSKSITDLHSSNCTFVKKLEIKELMKICKKTKNEKEKILDLCQAAKKHKLTNKETIILRMLLDGLSNTEISQKLKISRENVTATVRYMQKKAKKGGTNNV